MTLFYQVVDRYKDRIHYWELGMKETKRISWVGTWEEQLELVKVGAKL